MANPIPERALQEKLSPLPSVTTRSVLSWVTKLGLSIGDTITCRQGDSHGAPITFHHWNEYQLTLKWVGERYVIWTYAYRSDNSPVWEEYGEICYNDRNGQPTPLCGPYGADFTTLTWFKLPRN